MIITEKQIKKAEDFLDERYCIALQTDEHMGNKEGKNFLPNNVDYIYYTACIYTLRVLGLEVQSTKEGNKITHLIF